MIKRLHSPAVGGSGLVRPLGLLAAGCCGLLAGHAPSLAPAGAIVIAVGVAMLVDLAVGIVIFTIASFAAVLQFGGAVTGAKAVGLLLVLSWLVAVSTRTPGGRRSLLYENRSLVACAAVLLLWSAVSAVWADSPSRAIAGASRYAQDLLLFPIIYAGVRRSEHVRWVACAFVVGALLSAAYGLVAPGSADAGRLTGSVGDPNYMAAVLVAAAVLALSLFAGADARPWRWSALVGAVGALAGVAATASRGGLIALGVAGVAAVLVTGRWRRTMLITVTLSGAVIAFGLFVVAPSSVRAHVTSSQTSGRSTLWLVATRAIEAQPIAGLGTDNFQLAAKDYLVQPGATSRADLVIAAPHVAHNVYLEIWADLGIVGLLLFATVTVLSLRCAVLAYRAFARAGRRPEEFLARGLVVAVVGMLAADFFVSDLYSKQLWLLLALGPALLATARTAQQPRAAT